VSLRRLGWKAGLGLVLALGERLLANLLLRSEQGAEALMARGGRWLPAELLHEPAGAPRPVTVLAGGALLVVLALRLTVGAR
jgi:energy-coupling factor transport system permease protein